MSGGQGWGSDGGHMGVGAGLGYIWSIWLLLFGFEINAILRILKCNHIDIADIVWDLPVARDTGDASMGI